MGFSQAPHSQPPTGDTPPPGSSDLGFWRQRELQQQRGAHLMPELRELLSSCMNIPRLCQMAMCSTFISCLFWDIWYTRLPHFHSVFIWTCLGFHVTTCLACSQWLTMHFPFHGHQSDHMKVSWVIGVPLVIIHLSGIFLKKTIHFEVPPWDPPY